MAPTRMILHLALLLALFVRLGASADCSGPSAPAKYRYLFLADVKDDKPADIKAMADAYGKWIKSCGDLVVREGHAPAVSQDPSLFSFKTLPPNNYVGDFGAWSDYRSLDDLRACIAKGLKDGSVTAVRSYAVRAARVVFALNTTDGLVSDPKGRQDCAPGSFAPAKLHVMIAYVLKDPATVPQAIDLHHRINTANPTKTVRYGTGGRAALGKDEYVWGPGITKTADWGTWNDFASEADVRAYFSPPESARKLQAQLRGLSSGAMRVVIPLP